MTSQNNLADQYLLGQMNDLVSKWPLSVLFIFCSVSGCVSLRLEPDFLSALRSGAILALETGKKQVPKTAF